MRKLSKQNLEDMIMGCCYLGSGGGGSYDAGMKWIYADLEVGLTFTMRPVGEMKDEDYAATTYCVGSTAPSTPEQLERFSKLPRISEKPTAIAFRLLQKYTGKKFVATIAGRSAPEIPARRCRLLHTWESRSSTPTPWAARRRRLTRTLCSPRASRLPLRLARLSTETS